MFLKTTAKCFLLLLMPIIFFYAFVCRLIRSRRKKPSLLWGIEGLINDSYFADAMKVNYLSHSLAKNVFIINSADNFDIVLNGKLIKSTYYFFYVI